jgi:hypothetical protein
MTIEQVVSKLESKQYNPEIMADDLGQYVHVAVSDPAGDGAAGEESRREVRRIVTDRHWQIEYDGDSDGFGDEATSDLCIRRRR